MKISSKLFNVVAITMISATLFSACSDRYRNPEDDPRNQTTTVSPITQTPLP